MIVYIVGEAGSGKTTLARLLHIREGEELAKKMMPGFDSIRPWRYWLDREKYADLKDLALQWNQEQTDAVIVLAQAGHSMTTHPHALIKAMDDPQLPKGVIIVLPPRPDEGKKQRKDDPELVQITLLSQSGFAKDLAELTTKAKAKGFPMIHIPRHETPMQVADIIYGAMLLKE